MLHIIHCESISRSVWSKCKTSMAAGDECVLLDSSSAAWLEDDLRLRQDLNIASLHSISTNTASINTASINTASIVRQISYADFVELTITHPQAISWY